MILLLAAILALNSAGLTLRAIRSVQEAAATATIHSVTTAPKQAGSAGSPAKAAKEIARAVEAHYRHTKTMAAVFLEKYTSGGAGLRAETGTVYFSRPGRMRWDYDAPEKKTFLVDGKNVWYYVPADHTASRSSLKQSSDWRTPLALLADKMNLEKMCGSLTLSSAGANADANASANAKQNSFGAGDPRRLAEQGWSEGLPNSLPKNDPELRPTTPGNSVLVCGPRKEERDAFREVLLEINPRDQLVRVTIRQPGDIETEFRFGDWHENISIEETKFRFEPPKGVAIVDDSALAKEVQ